MRSSRIAFAIGLSGLVTGSLPALCQTLQAQLVGTWSLVSNIEEYADGSKADWGPDIAGRMILMPSGQFMFMLAAANRKKVEGNPSLHPVGQMISFFGTYTVTDADKMLTFKIERASSPSFDGIEQKRIIASIGEQMTFKAAAPIPSAKGPFVPNLVWKREK